MQLKTALNIDIADYLKKQKSLIDNYLKTLLTGNNYIEPKNLWEAVKYSLLDGGKRIRGILCLATFESFKNESLNNYLEDCLIIASSIELIHAMSLIHDDLPSMDNDDLRRGKPSCHKAFGEATAILTGDAMLSLAFQLIAEKTKNINNEQKLNLIKVLSRAFTFGLVPGQVLDLSKASKNCNLKEIEEIANLKTAYLIKASVLCGGIISGISPDESTFKMLSEFGNKIGIAFQIIDDILDVTSDTKTLGKTSGKDEVQNKPTYTKIIGIEKSKEMARELLQEAKEEIKSIPMNNTLLSSLADYIVSRTK